MSNERLKEAVERIIARKDSVIGKGEHATRQAMILPFVEAMGYDIWNPEEVCPEYEADTAIKKAGQKEKVDFAIVLNGVPKIFIEVKPLGETLAPHAGQLARYFNSTPSVVLSVITDGLEYQFFTDTEEPNIQDPEPFFVARLDAVDSGLDVVSRFTKPAFVPASIRDLATDLKYTAKVERFLRDELDLRDKEPSESLVKWILSEPTIWNGTRTPGVVSRFKPIVKQSLVRLLRDIVRRSVLAMDQGVSAPAPIAAQGGTGTLSGGPQPNVAAPETANQLTDVALITTARELACFDQVKAIFDTMPQDQRKIWDQTLRKTVDAQLGHKDTTVYFGIYINKPSVWVVRCVMEQRKPYVGFDLSPEEIMQVLPPNFELLPQNSFAPSRVSVSGPEDLAALKPVIQRAIQKHLNTTKTS